MRFVVDRRCRSTLPLSTVCAHILCIFSSLFTLQKPLKMFFTEYSFISCKNTFKPNVHSASQSVVGVASLRRSPLFASISYLQEMFFWHLGLPLGAFEKANVSKNHFFTLKTFSLIPTIENRKSKIEKKCFFNLDSTFCGICNTKIKKNTFSGSENPFFDLLAWKSKIDKKMFFGPRNYFCGPGAWESRKHAFFCSESPFFGLPRSRIGKSKKCFFDLSTRKYQCFHCKKNWSFTEPIKKGSVDAKSFQMSSHVERN